jgi:hypothetical protein
MELSELVAAVKAHAHKHYEDGGWDVIVECYSDKEIEEYLAENAAVTVEAAIAAFEPLVDVWADRQAEAQSEANAEREAAHGDGWDGFYKRNGDREDFHSDEGIGSADDEPHYPDI